MDVSSINIVTVLLAYLLGAIPFGLVLARLAGYGDIREIGSGNIGATNVLRTGNKALALIVLLLDSGKGAIAVLLTAYLVSPDVAPFAGAAAFLGHCYPVYLKFRGGKGVATFFGTILAINWMIGLACILIWMGMAAIFRFSSLAGMTAAVAAPAIAGWQGDRLALWVLVMIAAIVLLRHRENIARLVKGEEPKIGKRSGTS